MIIYNSLMYNYIIFIINIKFNVPRETLNSLYLLIEQNSKIITINCIQFNKKDDLYIYLDVGYVN